jgi:hypothetical protein
MRENDFIQISDNVEIFVQYDYYKGCDGLWTLPNGDPGYPPEPDELEIVDIILTKGKLMDLLYEFKGWDWLEGKLFELND